MPGEQRTEPTRLAVIRKRRGLTQEELAQATGVPLTTIYKLESRQNDNPRIRHLRNLAIALDVPLEALLEEEWKGWTAFAAAAGEPPDLEQLPASSAPATTAAVCAPTTAPTASC